MTKKPRRSLPLGLLTVAVLVMACSAFTCNTPPEQVARNVIATGSGAISSAQSKYLAQCTKDPSGQICSLINRSVDAQNAAVTGLETYCGIALSATLDPAQKCTPVKSALPALNTAIANLNQLISELKAAAGVSLRQRNPIPVERPEPMNSGIPFSLPTVSLGLLGMRLLLDQLLKGKAADYTDDTIAAVQAAIAEFETVQGTEVTAGQLEALRLTHMWPDSAPPLKQTPPV